MSNLNRLKIVLVEQNKTGKWLAGILWISNCAVSEWHGNTSQPGFGALNEITDILGVGVKGLLTSNNNSR